MGVGVRMILQMWINNGPRASLAVVHLTNVLFGKMDSSGVRHSGNVVCQAITLNMLVHSTPSYRVAFVAHFHVLKRIWMFGTSHSIYFYINAVDIQGSMKFLFAAFAASP